MTNLFRFGRRFRRELTAPGAMVPLYREPHHLAKGVAIHVALAKKHNPAATWLCACDTVMRERQALAAVLRDGCVFGTPFLLVSWPDLLMQAELPPNPHTRLVHELLWLLRGVVRDYDPVLATDLDTLYKNYARTDDGEKRARPDWLGQTEDVFEVARFNAHLTQLTTDSKFLREVRIRAERFFPLAVPAARAKMLRELNLYGPYHSLFDPAALANPAMNNSFAISEPADPWAKELDWLIGGQSGASDGCYRFNKWTYGTLVLVDWSKLVEIACHQQRGSLLEAFVDPGNCDYVLAGQRARRVFAERFPGVIAARRPHQELAPLVQEYGLTLEHALDRNPFEVYNLLALINARTNYQHRAAAARQLVKVARDKLGGAPRRNVVNLEYEDRGVAVIKYGGLFYFSLPYTLWTAYEERALWEKKRLRFGSTDFWNARGINQHANGGVYYLTGPENQKLEREVSPLDEARPFCEWVNFTAIPLLSGPGFKRKLLEQRYPERIQQMLREDRAHLGPFMGFEDDALREFCEKRGHAGAFTADEWQALERLLPQRSRVAIRRRRDHLGFQYALLHGYTAYTKSGFCSNRNYLRRDNWRSQGVRA